MRQAKAALSPSPIACSTSRAGSGSSSSSSCAAKMAALAGSASLRSRASSACNWTRAWARADSSLRRSSWASPPCRASAMSSRRSCCTIPIARPGEAETPPSRSGSPVALGLGGAALGADGPAATPASPSPASSNFVSCTTAALASAPRATIRTESPSAMSSPMIPTTLRALTESAPRSSRISAAKDFAALASTAAGRACRPSGFAMRT